MSDLRTPAEAAVKLLANPRTLERWRTQGTGPAFVKIGRKVAYTDQDLDAFIKRQRRQHTAEDR
jgi:Helix-turn-helix domain